MANEFVIKNGYFSQGNSNVTGSLQVSGSIGAYNSGSDVLSVYGSQGNLLVVTDTFSGSLFTISDISGYPILDITSDYYTSSINTIGFLNHTGSAGITGSLIVSGGFKVYDALAGFDNIDGNIRYLYSSDGQRSVLWGDRILKDTAGSDSINWDQRRLTDGTADTLNWSNRVIYYPDGTTEAINWATPNEILVSGSIIPAGPYTSNTSSYDLGSPTAAWSKIYVSNNSLHFVSGSVSASIGFNNGVISFNDTTVNIPTGSTVLTSSFAETASYALNGGVTQIVAGTNITITNGGSGSVTISSTGGGSGAGANVTASFTNQSTWIFTHGLGNRGVVVQTFDTSWNQTIPQNITLTDTNTATIVFPLNQSGFAIASLGGVVSTAATASSVSTLNQNVIITGSLAIGTGSVGSGENNLLLGPAPAGGSGEGGQLGLLAAGGSYTSSSFIDNWQNQFRILRGPGASSNAGLMYMDLQTGNTQFVGAVTASAYNGLPNSWLHALRNGSQTIGSGTWASRDIIFNEVSSNNFTYNSSTGIATLRANKTYRLTARLAWSAAGLYTLKFRVYNQTTSAFTGPTVEMIQSPNGTFNVSDNTLEHILAVGASDIDISIRTTSDTNALTGEFIRGDLNTQLIIQQIA